MNPDAILQIISQWTPVVVAVAGIVGTVAACIKKVTKTTDSQETRLIKLEKKMDAVLDENIELKKRLNQDYYDKHKIYTRNHGKKD